MVNASPSDACSRCASVSMLVGMYGRFEEVRYGAGLPMSLLSRSIAPGCRYVPAIDEVFRCARSTVQSRALAFERIDPVEKSRRLLCLFER